MEDHENNPRLMEATKGQMKANGIPPEKVSETMLVLTDEYGNMHVFDVSVDKVRPEWVVPEGFDLHDHEPKMKDYFGPDAMNKLHEKQAGIFARNHGAKELKVQESMGAVLAAFETVSIHAYALGVAFRSTGLPPSVYKPFFHRALVLIREGS